jgi:hypothetical protein
MHYGLAFKVAEQLGVFLENQSDEPLRKLGFIFQGFDTHLSYLFGFPSLLTRQFEDSFFAVVRPHSFESNAVTTHQQMIKLFFSFSDLTKIMYDIVRYEKMLWSPNGPVEALSIYQDQEYERINQQLSAWFNELPSFVRHPDQKFGMNQGVLNEQGILDPLPLEAAHLFCMYYYGKMKLNKNKLSQVLATRNPQPIRSSETVQIMREALSNFSRVVEQILAGNPHMEFFLPFTLFMIYEVFIFGCKSH